MFHAEVGLKLDGAIVQLGIHLIYYYPSPMQVEYMMHVYSFFVTPIICVFSKIYAISDIQPDVVHYLPISLAYLQSAAPNSPLSPTGDKQRLGLATLAILRVSRRATHC